VIITGGKKLGVLSTLFQVGGVIGDTEKGGGETRKDKRHRARSGPDLFVNSVRG